MHASKHLFLSLVLSACALATLSLSQEQRAFASDGSTLPNLAQPVNQIPIMVTTSDGFEGYRIKEYKGIVRGVTVREPGPISSFKANLKSIVGGKISPFVRMCETAREEAMNIMVERAQAVGANAVIAFRYDSSSYGDSDEMGTEVVCYGTAVVLAPRDQKTANLLQSEVATASKSSLSIAEK